MGMSRFRNNMGPGIILNGGSAGEANWVTARFNHLDILTIGEDHVFIIHRQLLLQDIHDYLTRSPNGLQRVFVNIDHHLAQPEIMPANRYKALEDYIRHTLLPHIQHRIESWDLAEESYESLAVPHRLSIVTLTGWLLSYPINYVLPGTGRRYSSGTCSGTCSALAYDSFLPTFHAEESTQECDDEEDDEQDDGRNALANQTLVITSVQLGPNQKIADLREHCFLSFSYPAELAERVASSIAAASSSATSSSSSSASSTFSPSAPSSPLVSPLSPMPLSRATSSSIQQCDEQGHEFISTPSTTPTPPTQRVDADQQQRTRTDGTKGMPPPTPLPSNASSPVSKSGAQGQDRGLSQSSEGVASELSPRLPSSESFDVNRPLPFSNPDICAAGRSFLTVLHARFQQQKIWTTWQVGQESVTLPVVAM
ncbi:hypothetical protein BG004_007815 [Podila humilis]|nr:hypothetical protein BG004_007815 [Podila humilis]